MRVHGTVCLRRSTTRKALDTLKNIFALKLWRSFGHPEKHLG